MHGQRITGRHLTLAAFMLIAWFADHARAERLNSAKYAGRHMEHGGRGQFIRDLADHNQRDHRRSDSN